MNPIGANNDILSAGWFATLAKAYPKAVQQAGMGAQNDPSTLESELKYRIAAEAQGWKVVNWQVPPISVTDWTPYVQELQSKGVEALWPSPGDNIAPYVQAMNTAGYDPPFMILGTQFYSSATAKAAASAHFPTTYVETQFWPLELAAKSPSTSQLLRIMHTYAHGDQVDFNDEIAVDSWLLFAKSATSCGTHLTVACVLAHASTTKNWDAGGISAPVKALAMSDDNPTPTPCFALLKVEPGAFAYAKSVTDPTQSIWNCNPKGLIRFTKSQLTQITAAS